MPSSRYPSASSNIAALSEWKPASVMNWKRYPSAASSSWKAAIRPSSRCLRQLKEGEQL
jgi:hypothetical protein